MTTAFDAMAYLRAIPRRTVREIHLAGYTCRAFDVGVQMLIDTHSAPVADPVWALDAAALQRFVAVPTLIEWDAELPPPPMLCEEAAKADLVMEPIRARAA
jgi:uncharacterized protein